MSEFKGDTMSNLDELRLKRGQVVDQMKGLIDGNPGDKWTDEIESSYQAMDADQTAIKNQIDRAENQARLDGEMNKIIDKAITTTLDPKSDKKGVASGEYRDAFLNLCRVGKNNAGMQVLNALEVGTASEGGNIVPTEMEAMIVEYLQDFNEFRQYVNVIQTSTDREIPLETTLGVATWTAEEAAYTESDPAFGKVTLSSHKLGRIVKVSEELVQDSIFDLFDYLARNFGKAWGLAEESAIVAGDNSGKPNGFVTAASTGKTAVGTTAITTDELIDLYHSLSRPYRAGAVFSMADATLASIRKLKDTTNQYIWQPGLQAGQADMLLGKPVIATSAQPAMTTGLDAVSFGDLSYYYLVERTGRTIQVLNELYAANGQVGYRGWERIDGDLVDTNAVKNLTMA
jgi:HK97 family phage major capsid protein